MASQIQLYTFGQILDNAKPEHIKAFCSRFNLDITKDNVREDIVTTMANRSALRDEDQTLASHPKFSHYLYMSKDDLIKEIQTFSQADFTNNTKAQMLRYILNNQPKEERVVSPRIYIPNQLDKQTPPLVMGEAPLIKTNQSMTTAPTPLMTAAQPPLMTAAPSTIVAKPQIRTSQVVQVNPSRESAKVTTSLPLKTQVIRTRTSKEINEINEKETKEKRETKMLYENLLTVMDEEPVLIAQNNSSHVLYLGFMSGIISIFDLKKNNFLDFPFLDLNAKDDEKINYLLLDLVFHPQFENNNIFYLSYCCPTDDYQYHHLQRVSKFIHNKESSYNTLSTEDILIEIKHPSINHIGGSLILGPINKGEYTLYYAVGDGDQYDLSYRYEAPIGKLWQIYPSSHKRVKVASGLNDPVDLFYWKNKLHIIDLCSHDDFREERVLIYKEGTNYICGHVNLPRDVDFVFEFSTENLFIERGNYEIPKSMMLEYKDSLLEISYNGNITNRIDDGLYNVNPQINTERGLIPLYSLLSCQYKSKLIIHKKYLYLLIGKHIYLLAEQSLLTEMDINNLIESTNQASKNVASIFRTIPDDKVHIIMIIYDLYSDNYIIMNDNEAWKDLEEKTKIKAKMITNYSSNNNALSGKNLTLLIRDNENFLIGISPPGFGIVPLYKPNIYGHPSLIGALAIAGDGDEINETIALMAAEYYLAPPDICLH